jgi:hypothetical protein
VIGEHGIEDDDQHVLGAEEPPPSKPDLQHVAQQLHGDADRQRQAGIPTVGANRGASAPGTARVRLGRGSTG